MDSDHMLDFIRLSELPDLAASCASFHAGLAGDDTAEGYEMRLAAFRKLALDGEREDVIVAYRADGAKEGQIVGLAALVQTDLEAFDDLGPWVSAISVATDLKDTSMVLDMVEKIEAIAREYGHEELFIATAEPGQHRARGYQIIEPFDKNGSDYWVLGKAL
nr:hypothetical protein [uncultured Cohaesibacter sp.]